MRCRANHAAALGLVKCLADDGVRDARVMATALNHLPQQRKPSDIVVPGLLDGLDNVNRLADRMLAVGPQRAVSLVGSTR